MYGDADMMEALALLCSLLAAAAEVSFRSRIVVELMHFN
jgi:hypothetical protein